LPKTIALLHNDKQGKHNSQFNDSFLSGEEKNNLKVVFVFITFYGLVLFHYIDIFHSKGKAKAKY